jgi:hypothetical protein
MIYEQRCRSWLILSYLLVLLAVALPVHVQAQTPSTAPLIQSNNLSYLGSFRVPTCNAGGQANACFEYGGTALSFNPARNSLYIVGHDWDQFIGEISIPSFGSTATLLQTPKDVTGGKRVGSGTWKIGGTFPYNNQLYFTEFLYYDAAGEQTQSHLIRSLDLGTGQVSGPSRVGPLGAGFYSGYMAEIPSEWQPLLGGQALTGNCCLSIISRTSYGPAVFAFNPSTISSTQSAVSLVYYDSNHQTLGAYGASGSNPVFNGTSRVKGVVFPQGTASILFFGRTGTGDYCYGEAAACGDPTNGSKGEHAYPYAAYVWAYNANDLAAVRSGSKQPWQITPYATWALPGLSGNSEYTGSAAYDPATGRIFVSEMYGDGERPTIHVYKVNIGTTPPPPTPAPTINLSASPASVVSGGSSTLSWGSTNATSCAASEAWSGAKAVSGSQSTGTLTATATYSLTCTGAGGSITQSATVTVTAPPTAPTVGISASPTSVISGSPSTLSWNSTNATSCTASGAWSGTKAISGSQSTGALTATATYSLACAGPGGSASQSATVTVTLPPTTQPPSSSVNVSNVSGLQSAIAGLTSNKTILLADGTYNITGTLYLPQNVSNVAIKGVSGNRDAVIIRGPGMTNSSVAFGFWADNVNGVTFQDMTIRDFNQHAIILNGGVDSPVYRNLHIIDIGDQFLKNNPTLDGLNGIDNGILENSLLEYSSTAPDSYTNGLDVHRGKNWIVRGNTFKNFRSSVGLAGPAVLIWNGSSDTTVVRNTFMNNQRDISLGLDPTKPAGGVTDHARGLIANNFIYKTSSIGPDVPIAVFDSPQTKVYYNTILVNGGYPNAIEYRFSRTTGVDIKNNLTDASIISRDGASGFVSNNVTNATSNMFVNPATGDLHLRSTASTAIDKGMSVAVSDDFDGQSRLAGNAPDVGADEYNPSTSLSPPAAPGNLVVR